MRYFYGILDIATINSFILFKCNSKKDSFPNNARSTFLKNLAFSLTKPFMEQRSENQRISKELRFSIFKMLGKNKETCKSTTKDNPTRKRRRCDFCDLSKDRKGNEFCRKCSSCLCGEHKSVLRCV